MAHLSLGTAQFGNSYGETNVTGLLGDDTIAQMFAVARQEMIQDIDTAMAYGNALERISSHVDQFRVTSKVLGKLALGPQLEATLETLGVTKIHSLLIHDWSILMPHERVRAVAEIVTELRAGYVECIGVSIYEENEAEAASKLFEQSGSQLHALQLPANPLDRRLDRSSVIERLAFEGTRIAVRSVFLQGILLSNNHRFASHPDLQKFHALTGEQHSSQQAIRICLAHAKSLPWVSEVIVGATSPSELRQVCSTWQSVSALRAPSEVASNDLGLIDPRRWSQRQQHV